MELLSVIRRWALRDRLSIREIARRTGLSRNTIRKYLRGDVVEPAFKLPERASKLDAFAAKLATWLKLESGRPRKQRRTVKQLHADLVALGFEGSYGRVAAFARSWKEHRQQEQQTAGRGTFVPLVFQPGEAFQFDWSEDWAVIGGAVGLSFGSYLPAYFARFLPAVLPYVAWAAVFSHGHAAIHDLLAVCVFLFAIGNVQLARGFNASFIAVQNARFENSDLAAELRVQKEAAEAATLAKSRFLAAASHDLRQPVHALSLFVGALHGTELPADAHRLLDHIQTSVASVDGLFASLLDISRLDAGVVTAKAETFPIQPLLERIARDHAADAAQKHIALRLYASSAFVVTDQLLLERVLRNLVSNAIRYTDHGRVVIGCRRHGDAVSVQVLDTGRGIPAAAREQIFEEFHQLHEPGNERNPGLGLGLAIVRRLCELLSLPLSLTSTESRGSCFSVDVPLAASPTLSEAADEPGILTQPAGLILVIDDNDGIREAMGALLRRWGHETVVAATGETMLALADRTPDLIIADYHLGQSANGLQTIAALRKHFGATVPAMIITGDTALDVPDILVLRKPVPHARLRASVLRLLRKEEALLF